MEDSFWNKTVHTVFLGMCHTFQFPGKVGSQAYMNSFVFALDPNLSYQIYLHDPKYYYIVINPTVSPRLYFDLKVMGMYIQFTNHQIFYSVFFKPQIMEPGKYILHYFSVTQHELLHDPSEPTCNPDPHYVFISCIKSHFAKKVGCKPPWDSWSPDSFPVCNSLEQLSMHENLDFLYLQYDKVTLLNESGCFVPCNFKEYTQTQKQVSMEGQIQSLINRSTE